MAGRSQKHFGQFLRQSGVCMYYHVLLSLQLRERKIWWDSPVIAINTKIIYASVCESSMSRSSITRLSAVRLSRLLQSKHLCKSPRWIRTQNLQLVYCAIGVLLTVSRRVDIMQQNAPAIFQYIINLARIGKDKSDSSLTKILRDIAVSQNEEIQHLTWFISWCTRDP